MAVKIRNAVSETCEGCFKRIVYEKDEDSGLDSLQIEGVWMQLCEECAEPYHERERYLNKDEEDEGSVRYDCPER